MARETFVRVQDARRLHRQRRCSKESTSYMCSTSSSDDHHTEEQLTGRMSLKQSFMAKIQAACQYDRFQFVYDFWVWSRIMLRPHPHALHYLEGLVHQNIGDESTQDSWTCSDNLDTQNSLSPLLHMNGVSLITHGLKTSSLKSSVHDCVCQPPKRCNHKLSSFFVLLYKKGSLGE